MMVVIHMLHMYTLYNGITLVTAVFSGFGIKTNYMIVNQTKTWNDASVYCKSLGGNLVHIDYESENDHFSLLKGTYWIGLRSRPSKGFVWENGDKYTQFTYGWDKMEQKSRTKTGCVVWNNLKWDVVPCVSKTYYFICEYTDTSTTSVLSAQTKSTIPKPHSKEQTLTIHNTVSSTSNSISAIATPNYRSTTGLILLTTRVSTQTKPSATHRSTPNKTALSSNRMVISTTTILLSKVKTVTVFPKTTVITSSDNTPITELPSGVDEDILLTLILILTIPFVILCCVTGIYCLARVRLERKAKKSTISASSNLGSNVLSDIDDWDNRTWITGASLYNVDKHPISKSLESIRSMPPDYITATTIPGWGNHKDFATLMINTNDHSSTSYYDKVYSNQPGYELTSHPAKYQRCEHFPGRTSSEPRPDYMDQYLHRPHLYPNDDIISIPLRDYPH